MYLLPLCLLLLASNGSQAQPLLGALRDLQRVFSSAPAPISTVNEPSRLAIIGAGAAGSSSAYFARLLARLNGVDVDVTMCVTDLVPAHAYSYEQGPRIGGRSTTIKLDDEEIEIGASIFVPANRHLEHAVDFFNLTRESWGLKDDRTAIWDGEKIVFEESSFSWFSGIKLLWQYGRTPFKVKAVVKSVVDSFIRIYDSDFQALGPFKTIPELANAVQLQDLYRLRATDWLGSQSIEGPFVDDFIGAAVRVNYGSSPQYMHALGSMVSMAASGASSVEGGNFQLFESFAKHSGATVHLNTRVTSLIKLDSGRWIVETETGRETYDAVIIAAPLQTTGIKFVNSNAADKVPRVDYVHLHVTIVVTSAPYAGSEVFLGPGSSRSMPRSVLATFARADRGELHRPSLNSLSYLRKLKGNRWVVKQERVDDDRLDALFGSEHVQDVYKFEFDAYPELRPIDESRFAPVRLDHNLFYANIEPFISTMETETLAGWNAVNSWTAQTFGFHSNVSWPELEPLTAL